MRLILAVDAVVAPLTGIGRYALELARHYSEWDDIFSSRRFLFGNVWVDDLSELLESGPPKHRSYLPHWFPERCIQTWMRRRSIRGCVFHSPNYFLPREVDHGIVTVHDLSVFKFPETHPIARVKQFERDFESTLKRTTHIITDSEATRKEVSDYFGWPLEDITAVRLGVPEGFRRYSRDELVSPLQAYGLVPNRYSLCISTLEPRKRIDRLLCAYANLPVAIRSRYPLVLGGGSGWLSDALMEQIRVGESAGWLRYLGYVPEKILPALYAGARSFIYPSMYEGFGLPVLEALASGVPTLTSNCSSLPEVANGAAWLVETDNEEELCAGIAKILIDDGWRDAAVTRGLEVARGSTWSACARDTFDVYRRFL
ncbi:glycosyltransferase family 4 protein [Burkholderia contaminans]|uniref:glycosyltransferase family 4 protein n=1 Tax=Burkholderia contaminans TaxID=488447 RepID=UPI0014546B92|nr:glycosyltransferase family 1 protein [Burkholderia contaminans]MCA8154891.1 glycosyltransferase family 4 protein [Burkholderia contaminans]VWD34326.1 group 1 family glycosyl transferase [Burkholderia contaminans]